MRYVSMDAAQWATTITITTTTTTTNNDNTIDNHSNSNTHNTHNDNNDINDTNNNSNTYYSNNHIDIANNDNDDNDNNNNDNNNNANDNDTVCSNHVQQNKSAKSQRTQNATGHGDRLHGQAAGRPGTLARLPAVVRGLSASAAQTLNQFTSSGEPKGGFEKRGSRSLLWTS